MKAFGDAKNFRNHLNPTAFMWLLQRHMVVMIKTGTRTMFSSSQTGTVSTTEGETEDLGLSTFYMTILLL